MRTMMDASLSCERGSRGLLKMIFALCILPLAGSSLLAEWIDISTQSGDWRIAANGGSNVAPYRFSDWSWGNNITNVIGIGPIDWWDWDRKTNVVLDCGGRLHTNSTYEYLHGLDPAQFNGYWTASLRFFVPSDAQAIALVYGTFFADDRAVLLLNDNVIDSAGLPGPTGSVPVLNPTNLCIYAGTTTITNGRMVLINGSPDTDYTFHRVNSAPRNYSYGTTITNGFILGATNELRCIVNNTGYGITYPMNGVLFDAGDTALVLYGYVGYGRPVLSIGTTVTNGGWELYCSPSPLGFSVYWSENLSDWTRCAYRSMGNLSGRQVTNLWIPRTFSQKYFRLKAE